MQRPRNPDSTTNVVPAVDDYNASDQVICSLITGVSNESNIRDAQDVSDVLPEDLLKSPLIAGTTQSVIKGTTTGAQQMAFKPNIGITILQDKSNQAEGIPSGIRDAILGTRVGSERKVYVPNDLGFGADGNASFKIPPYAPFVFEFKILKLY
ncbi:hypothetical protein CVT24_002743 [Panaeolus cyanescens]|uniref:peptidylprolyl isomerase n=1 Tax=Panaeolus cyanescens TaxID=181874 RepID=A0A409WJ94_9AGAR|nr:hypothetical protein CVT24_002743 [Panaeolus cyanescens]